MDESTAALNFSAITAVLEPMIYERVLACITVDKIDTLVQVAIERCVEAAVERALDRLCGGYGTPRSFQDKVRAFVEEQLAAELPGGLEGHVRRLVRSAFTPAKKKKALATVRRAVSEVSNSHIAYRMDQHIEATVDDAVRQLITQNADILTTGVLEQMAKMQEKRHGV